MADRQSMTLPGPIGVTGLVRYDGYVFDEWMPELQGARGRRVLREMLDNDALIGAIQFTIEMFIRQVEWMIRPGTRPDGQEDEETAEFIEESRDDMAMTWEDTIAEILSVLPYGFSPHELLYKLRDGVGSKYNDGRIGWHSWPIRGQETLMRWEFDPMGQVTAMWQLGAPDWVEHCIPMEKMLLFRTTSRRGNPEGRSIYRNAYRPYYFRKNIQNIEAIGVERDLVGLPVMYVPDELLDPEASPEAQATAKQYEALIKRIRRDEQEGVLLPGSLNMQSATPVRNFELKLLQSGGERQFNTGEIIQRYSLEILMTSMADILMLGHDNVGSYSLGVAKGQMFATALGAWLDMICAVINEQGINRLLKLNGIQYETPPRLEHGRVERSDLDVLGTFLYNIAAAGIPLDTRADGPLVERLMAEASLPKPPAPEELEDDQDPNVAEDQTPSAPAEPTQPDQAQPAQPATKPQPATSRKRQQKQQSTTPAGR